jgi:uncharacterized protein (DUF1499 family)
VPRPLRTARLGFGLSVLAVVTLVLAPILYRVQMMGLGALIFAAVAVVLALAALILSSVGMRASRRLKLPQRRAAAGLVLSLLVLAFPVVVAVSGAGAPGIHDVTTDTVDVPQYVAVLPIRERTHALNTVAYGGEPVAAQQKAAFPDIQPVHLDVPPSEAFTQAVAAANDMNWELVAADEAAGRIEATDTTKLWNFKDDVVVRLRPDGTGTRVDVRSLSRVGGGDLGTNARRVRAYLTRLRAAK